MKIIIQTSGNWCSGYYAQIINSATGRTLKELGPYHGTRLEEPRRVAVDDATEYAEKQGWERVR